MGCFPHFVIYIHCYLIFQLVLQFQLLNKIYYVLLFYYSDSSNYFINMVIFLWEKIHISHSFKSNSYQDNFTSIRLWKQKIIHDQCLANSNSRIKYRVDTWIVSYLQHNDWTKIQYSINFFYSFVNLLRINKNQRR